MNYKCFSSAGGVGDSVCAMYAASGVAESLPEGDQIHLYTAHKEWLTRVYHPKVKLIDPWRNNDRGQAIAHSDMGADMSTRYNDQLKQSRSRKQWFADSLCDYYHLARADARQPYLNKSMVSLPPEGYIAGSYVVLSPFSDWTGRVWPMVHYLKLTAELTKVGWRVIVIGLPRDKEVLETHFSKTSASYFWGMTPEWVQQTLANAALVVGNDSGIAHVASMLNVPTVAVMAQLSPRLVFSHTDVQTVVPIASCSPCAWQGYRGWIPSCDSLGCSALMGIGHEIVTQRCLTILKNQP